MPTASARRWRTRSRSRDVAIATTSAALSIATVTARDQSALGAAITNTTAANVSRNTAP
jgi:hypothetical protein